MVIGDRLSTTYFSENKRRFHNFGNQLVRSFIQMLWGNDSCRILDVMTGYRAFSPIFVKSFPILSQGFEIETEMTIHALEHNLFMLSIPVKYRDRPQGSVSKLDTYKDGFKVIKTMLNLFRSYCPMKFFGFIVPPNLGDVFGYRTCATISNLDRQQHDDAVSFALHGVRMDSGYEYHSGT